jgi:hypothetical protein
MQAARTESSGAFWRLLAFIIVLSILAIIGVNVSFSMDHAVDRHGSIAVVIKNACEQKPDLEMTRPLDGRKGIGCEYMPGKFGVTIYEENGDHVTSFPNKSKTIDRLIRYFENRGYK